MLTARITNSLGEYRDYREEFVDFSFLTSNNEGTPFTASVPRLTSVVKLLVVDDFVKTLARGDTIEVMSDELDGLTLYLSVIEVTILSRKGTTEISCTGMFFDETNDIWGALLIDKDTWENTKLKYSLDDVEHYEDNDKFYVHVSSKLDIVMGLAWSYDTRRTVALTPFTTGDSATFHSPGVGIFKEIREDSTVDPYAPVYRIRAEDIINYDISPAQPPVTHVVANSLGKSGLVPTIPEIIARCDIREYNAYSMTRFANIEELQLAAVMVVHMTPDEEGGSDDYDKTVIYWSDGVQTELTKTDFADPYDVQFVGITPVGYLLLDADGVTYKLYDRDTKAVLKTFVSTHAHSSYTPFSYRDYVLEHYVLGADRKYHTVILFSEPVVFGTGTARKAFVGFSISDDLVIRELIMPYTSLYAATNIQLAGSCKVTWDGKNAVSALYHNAGDATESVGVSGDLLRASQFTTDMYSSEKVVNLGGFSSTRYYKNITDFLATNDEPSDEYPAYLLSSGANKSGSLYSKRVGMDIVKGSTHDYLALPIGSNKRRASRLAIYSNANLKFVIDKDIIVKRLSEFHVIDVPQESSGQWHLLAIYHDTAYHYATMQTGNLESWAFDDADKDGTVYVEHGAVGLIRWVPPSNYDEEEAYGVSLQLAPVPFVVRDGITQLTPQMISLGSRNELNLPFRVGMLSQRDMAMWDEDKGRIELDISSFQVRNNTTLQWLDKSVQALNVMAIGAYVKVWLTPGDEDDYVLVKVLEYSLTYSGVVRAKLVGMIVQEEFYEPPVPLPDRYVLVDNANDLTTGDYLIAYSSKVTSTTGKVFKSSLATLDAKNNNIDVAIGYDEDRDERFILASALANANKVRLTVSGTAITIRAANGKYITRLTSTNGLDQVDSPASLVGTVTSAGETIIGVQATQMVLRYNNDTSEKRFRFYKLASASSQKSIRLFKFVAGE